MKLRIIERGYEGFTGLMGVTFFENAVTVDDVPWKEAEALSALFKVVDAETGAEVGAFARERAVWDNANIPQPEPLKTLAQQPELKVASATPATPTQKQYTRESLEALADKGGMSALRRVGAQFDVKNSSIAGLIDEILTAQNAK